MNQAHPGKRQSKQNHRGRQGVGGNVIAAVVVLALAVASIWAFTGGRVQRMPGDVVTVYPNPTYEVKTVNATLDETGLFTPTTNDPQFPVTFDTPMEVQSFEIALQAPLGKKTHIELYYCGEGEKLSESKVQRFTLPAKSTGLITAFPAGMCKKVRVDINGTAALGAIRFGSSRPVNAIRWYAWLLLALFIVAIAIMALSILNSRKRRLRMANSRQAAMRKRQANAGSGRAQTQRTSRPNGTTARPPQRTRPQSRT